MAGLNSWQSPAVLHALGWALIHSLWQCAAVSALAALAMAFIRRPAVRYLIGVGALAVMLAAPVATFFILMKPVASVSAMRPATASLLPTTPPLSTPVAVFATADRAIGAIADAPRQLPDVLPWLVAAWACGVAFFSLRFAGGFLLLEHRRRAQSHRPGEPVLALCLDLQRRLGLDRAIEYLECTWVEAPAVIGWLRPAVLLPVFALTGLSEEQVRAVIAHELAHIRRHDWLVNLFQVLVESLLFYHPAMWWLNRRIRIERELACDEIAVSLTGSRLEYARALAQMAEWKNVSLLAMAANRGPLTQRILHILGRGAPAAGQRVAGLTGGMLFLAAALAAANLLFGIAYPVQMAEAKESVKVALVSSQTAVEHLARQVVLSAKDAASPTVAPGQVDAATEDKADTLAVPLSDLSRLLPDKNLATPAVVAANAPPATPVQPASNASSAVTLNDQPVAPSTPRDLSAGPIQQALSTPPVTSPKLDTNAPYKRVECGFVTSGVGSGFVAGRVTSSTTVQMPRLICTGPGGGTGGDAGLGASFPMGHPCDRTQSIDSSIWGRYCPNVPWATMNVQLANPADASKMPLGKVVALKGDFFVITQNNVQYWGVRNARALYVDPFDREAANATVATMGASSKAQDMQLPPAEAALACLLGIAPDGCQNIFVDAGAAAHSVTYCAQQYHHRIWLSNGPFLEPCPDGPLEKVDYLGTNAAGADVYEVQYMHANMTYVIAQPGPDGKISQFWIKRGNPNGIVPSSLAEVPSSSAHRMSVYRRPAEWSDPVGRQDANASPAATQNDQPIPLASAAAPGQEALSTPPATLPKLDSNEPYKTRMCSAGPTSVTGRVTSSTTIQMPKFTCDTRDLHEGGGPEGAVFSFNSGPCKNPVRSSISLPWGRYCPNTPNTPWFTMTVQLANPADAIKMPLGKLVTLKGDFSVITQNKTSYLFVQNARVLYVDPFDRQVANVPPVAPPTPRDPSAGSVQAALGTPPAAPRFGPNEPYKITMCNVPNGARTCDLLTLASAAAPGLRSDPRARTELAVKCWLGLVEYKGCWKSICGDGGAGPLERVEYLGRTAAGADIYQVRYRYRATIAYAIAPDPQGTADQYLVKATDPYRIKREISSPAAPILIYARPEHAPLAGCSVGNDAGRQLNVVDSPPSLIQPATTP